MVLKNSSFSFRSGGGGGPVNRGGPNNYNRR